MRYLSALVRLHRLGPIIAGALLAALLSAYFVAGLAYLGLRHYVWPRLDDWRPVLTERLSALAGRPVEIGRIETGFEGLLPRLTVHALAVWDEHGAPVLTVPRATAIVSPRTLLDRELRLSVLQFERPSIRVERLESGRLRVAGLELDPDAPDDGSALAALMSQRRILIREASIDYVDRPRAMRATLEAIDLTLGSVGRRHRGAVRIGAPGPGWERAHVAFEFYREPRSRPADWRAWRGNAYAGVQGADAAAFTAFLPDAPALESARGEFKAWLGFDSGRPQDLRVKADASDLRWRAGERTIELRSLDADIEGRAEGAGYALRVQRLQAVDAGGFRVAALGEQQVALDANGAPVSARGSVAGFDAADALAFARRLPLSPGAREAIAKLRVSGRVAALSGSWTAGAAKPFEVSLDFERLSFRYGEAPPPDPVRPVPAMPWFENLSGQARIDPDGGELRVNAQRATLAFPGVFAEPAVPLDTLRSQARWTIARAGDKPVVAVEIAELRFANADAAGVISGTYRSGGKGPGIVELGGKLERADVRSVARYLPLRINPKVRDWVRSAVTTGTSDDVRFRLRGDLADFPYRSADDGEFAITGRVVDGTLAYAPDWPSIEKFQGTLAFERAGMRIQMRSGKVFDVALGATQAAIADFADPMLRIEGSGEGPASDMLRFVSESPLATRIDDFTRDARASGAARLQLRLALPLGQLERSTVAGAVRFQGNDLRIDNTIPPLANVSGALEFTERALALRAVQARFLGGEIRIDGSTPEPGRFQIRAEGRATAQGMRSVVDNPLTQALSGEASYRASIDVLRRAASVRIESDLRGIASSLPPPFAKAAQAQWPLVVQTVADAPPDPDARPARDTIRVTLRDALRDTIGLVVERVRSPSSERLLVRRAAFAVNAEPVLRDPGLAVALNTDEVDIDAWLPLLARPDLRAAGERAASEFEQGFSLVPGAVSAVAKRVRVAGKELHDVVLGATRVGGFWSANVSAREVNGYFNWREPEPGKRLGTLNARFTRLEVPRSRAREFESLLDSQPEDLPALDIVAEQFVLFDRPLGRLDLRATNTPTPMQHGWRLDELSLANRAARFKARGNWAPGAAGAPRGTRLDFDLEIADSGALLAIYGLKDAVRAGPGTIAGHLHWHGSPLAIDYRSLDGEMKVKLGKGQFLKTDPGLAKLIGVLNLQSLPRRLALDFRDVFAEGFAFDAINGDVGVLAGVARSENLQMRGVHAQVRIRGSANLAEETQALEVEVRPELNAGLASIAYGAIVNPVIGLGSLVAQFALRGPIQQILSYEYQVTGSWADPQVSERKRTPLPAQDGSAPQPAQPPSAPAR